MFGIKGTFLSAFADDINRRINNPINSQVHRLPDDPESSSGKKKRGRPPKAKPESDDNKPKRKPGRPKGSKIKKTLEQETSVASADKVKRGPGRPKGSKNKPKTDQKKRGPGRPKKSQNTQ